MKNYLKITIFLTTIIGLLTLFYFSNTISKLEKSQMDRISKIKSPKLEKNIDYFNSLKTLLLYIQKDKTTKEAFIAFENGFYKLEFEIHLNENMVINQLKKDFLENYLNHVNYDIPNSEQKKDINMYIPSDNNARIAQFIFITDNQNKLEEKNNLILNEKYISSYMNSHSIYHPFFNNILKKFGLYDIFLIDLNANIIYTDFKEKDFATNLKIGTYNNSGIAKVYEKALEKEEGEMVYEDFAPYEPSYNSEASFIGTPLFINGEKKGVLIFQMPVNISNNIMHSNTKFNYTLRTLLGW